MMQDKVGGLWLDAGEAPPNPHALVYYRHSLIVHTVITSPMSIISKMHCIKYCTVCTSTLAHNRYCIIRVWK
jgi:hypothetical protein